MHKYLACLLVGPVFTCSLQEQGYGIGKRLDIRRKTIGHGFEVGLFSRILWSGPSSRRALF